MANVR